MALGGGTFITQNKVLPGSYINFISAATASVGLSERGTIALPMPLDYAPTGVFEVTGEDMQKNTRKLFGCDYTDIKLRPLRDAFKHCTRAYIYNINGGSTAKNATNTYATAKYPGAGGNNFSIKIEAIAGDDTNYRVSTLLSGVVLDEQIVPKTNGAAQLADNDYVTFDKDATLAETAGTALSGGVTGTTPSYQDALDALEAYSFNTLGCTATDDTTKALFANYTKRLRDELGKKFQVVIHKCPAANADFEGVVNLDNIVAGTQTSDADYGALVYWLTGAEAGCEVNRSCTNMLYDGEYSVDINYTQQQLIDNINAGKLTLHRVDNSVRVLTDINSLVTYTSDKGKIFASNQTIRVIDQIANDIASLFNSKYLGVYPNDVMGRVELKADITSHHEQLQNIGAIENFDSGDVTVERGDEKTSVVVTDNVEVVGTMEKLYMTVVVA